MELVQNIKQIGTENRKENSKEHFKVTSLGLPVQFAYLKKKGFCLNVKFSYNVCWIFLHFQVVIVKSTKDSNQNINIEIQRNKQQQNVAYFSDCRLGFQAINTNFQISYLPNYQ